MYKKKLLDSFMNPRDRLIIAAKKDLEELGKLKPIQVNFIVIITRILEVCLNEIIINVDNVLEKRSIYSKTQKSNWIKYCPNTYGVIEDLGIRIFDDYFKSKVTNKIFNNIKLKDKWINNKFLDQE